MSPERKSPIDVTSARAGAYRNVRWLESHRLVNADTGEVLDGSLKDVSRSWACKEGAENNVKVIWKRLERIFKHPDDVRKYRPKFITVTFRKVGESWAAEGSIQKFLNALRVYCRRHSGGTFAYFWVAEVQDRGALHYHVLLLGVPYISHYRLAQWWEHGFIDVRAVDDLGRAFKYLAKYSLKWSKDVGDIRDMPDWWFYFSKFEKRRFGFGFWFRLPVAERIPMWLSDLLSDRGDLSKLDKARRRPGGGWELDFVSIARGPCRVAWSEVQPSMFKVVS